MSVRTVCVFCASSRQCDPFYAAAARDLGTSLAASGITIVTGGGSTGLMGAVADGALGAGGKVIGVLPRFMNTHEVAHQGLTRLHLVDGMHDRLAAMLEESDAFVALPGGCGTLEELFFVLTRKRLGLASRPLVIVNIRGYFDPCIAMLDRCISERFMDARHADMWRVVSSVPEVQAAIESSPGWDRAHSAFAVP
jgi:uncharacterized protein (TIGR00730 family)